MTTARRKLDWQALCDLDRDGWLGEPVRRARFLELYEAEVGGNRLYEADVGDAWGFESRLTWNQMLSRDYAAAAAELDRFFRHPDIERLDWRYRIPLQCERALCDLGQGREAEALAALREIIASGSREQQVMAAAITRTELFPGGLCPVLEREGFASEDLTRFVGEIALLHPHRRRAARKRPLTPRRATYARLRRHLGYEPPPPLAPTLTREELTAEARESVEEVRKEMQRERRRAARGPSRLSGREGS
ncbi:MAG: hypothetical protein ACK47B_07755 [Armatimonadota bacterium]